MRESDHLLTIHGKRQGQKTDLLPATLPEVKKGDTRDIVADRIGMSGRTFDKARAIWENVKNGNDWGASGYI